MSEEKAKKKWPRDYYATPYECTLKHLRHSNISRAKRAGVYGWRSWDDKANVLDTVKPKA
jgi:hypothetical protein